MASIDSELYKKYYIMSRSGRTPGLLSCHIHQAVLPDTIRWNIVHFLIRLTGIIMIVAPYRATDDWQLWNM